MDYYTLHLTLNPNTEIHRDVLSAELGEVGFESFVETDLGLNAFIPEKLYSEEKIDNLLKNLPLPDISVQYYVEHVKSRNWNEEWEKNFFQPLIIDNQVVIHSSFHKNIPQLPYDLVIEPKMAFGTGHHETTGLMISYLLEQDLSERSFLDMGCGTAVLAILAKKKNADRVMAIDPDEWAYKNALENVHLNRISGITIFQGDAGSMGKDAYDFIFANINRNILLNDIPVYARCMNKGSSLFMSGFYCDDTDIIYEKCKENQLQWISFKEKNNWTAVHFIKQ
jgi:ribosomal protein L11 methyltransferase